MFDSIESGVSLQNDFSYNNNVAKANIYIRMGFIRKVYGLLSAQLIITLVIASIIANFSEQVSKLVAERPFVLTLVIAGNFISLFMLLWKKRQVPINLFLLFTFTIFESTLIGLAVAHYSVNIVLQALALTIVTFISLTVYTFQTKKDFSSWGAGLFVFLFLLLSAGLLNFFLGSPLLDFAISVSGCVVFSLFIIYDTNAIMHRTSPEEYIIACVELYTDIINLFIHLLRFLDAIRDK